MYLHVFYFAVSQFLRVRRVHLFWLKLFFEDVSWLNVQPWLYVFVCAFVLFAFVIMVMIQFVVARLLFYSFSMFGFSFLFDFLIVIGFIPGLPYFDFPLFIVFYYSWCLFVLSFCLFWYSCLLFCVTPPPPPPLSHHPSPPPIS